MSRIGIALAFAFAFAFAGGRAMAQGGPDEHDAQEIRALSQDGVYGEIMDIAVEHCRKGERQQALALFAAMRQQLEPPPAIRSLIEQMEATKCDTPPLADGAHLRVQVSSGWDSNVSQGITARTLTLGTAEQSVELELDPGYRPRSSAYVQASADYSLVLPRYGVSVQFALGQRKNFRAREFDLRSASAAAAKEMQFSWGALRGQLELTQVWLGERNYQHTEGFTLQAIRSLADGAVLGTLKGTAVQYVTQPIQNATLWELGVLREWRVSAAASVNAGVAVQDDTAHSLRPGGQRLGYELQGGGVALLGRWRMRSQLTYTSWDSQRVFAPALIDVKRRNRLWQTSLVAETPLTTDLTLGLEWRGRWARDTIALYRYEAQSVSATVGLRF